MKRIRRYYAYSDDGVDLFIDGVAAEAEMVGDLGDSRRPARSEDDVIVATAIKANADFLVTGDRHLRSLGSHARIRVVSPRQFLDLLEPEGAES